MLVKSLADLNRAVCDLVAAEAISQTEAMRVASDIHVDIDPGTHGDPRSRSYHQAQFKLYEFIVGRPYSIQDEALNFDVAEAMRQPSLFGYGARIVGTHFLRVGQLIKLLDLPTGASVLQIGCRHGEPALAMANMGHPVLAIDFESNFLQLLRERGRRQNVEIEVRQQNAQSLRELKRRFDAVIFFDSFHRHAEPVDTLASLDNVVAPGVRVAFVDEPIRTVLGIPWGLVLSGHSILALRRRGGCRVEFSESFLRGALADLGWELNRFPYPDEASGAMYLGSRFEKLVFSAQDSRMRSQVGSYTRAGLTSAGTAGALMHGPYVELSPGTYRATVFGKMERAAGARIDVVYAGGSVVLAQSRIYADRTKPVVGEVIFSISCACNDLEVRIFVNEASRLVVTRLEIDRKQRHDYP